MKSGTPTVNTRIVANGDSRNVHLDIIKGALVLTMIVYHCASGSGLVEVAFLRAKLDFLHYAFLVLAGFLCGSHYCIRIKESPGKVQRRLMKRALKLFAIVLGANLVFWVVGLGGDLALLREALHYPSALVEFFSDGKNVAFEILYYIGVFLATCSLIIRFSARWPLAGAFVLLPCLIPGHTVRFVAFGYLGMLVGLFSQTERFWSLARWIDSHSGLLSAVLAAEVVFLAPLSRFVPEICSITLETILWFAAYVYVAKRFLGKLGQDWLILLGKYTLFAYMLHVVLVRIMFSILSMGGAAGITCYVLLLVIVTAGTLALVRALDDMRRLGVVDSLYRLAFG